jgi:ribonuclease P protein component
MALAKNQRLRRQKDIERVFRRSRKLETDEFIIRIHKKSTIPGRATVIVSKKVAKSAVIRNKFRRRISEWLRQEVGIGEIPIDCVISLKPAAIKLTRSGFSQHLLNLKKQIFAAT